VVYGKGKLKGFNTDYLGFSRHLKVLRVAPKKAAIIGAGGGARAVCFALAKIKAEEICIYDIDAYKKPGPGGQVQGRLQRGKILGCSRHRRAGPKE
jgi:hypothetical protein